MALIVVVDMTGEDVDSGNTVIKMGKILVPMLWFRIKNGAVAADLEQANLTTQFQKRCEK
jgi:hypothetical protein